VVTAALNLSGKSELASNEGRPKAKPKVTPKSGYDFQPRAETKSACELVLHSLHRTPCDMSIDGLLSETLFDAVAYRGQATGL